MSTQEHFKSSWGLGSNTDSILPGGGNGLNIGSLLPSGSTLWNEFGLIWTDNNINKKDSEFTTISNIINNS
jgi:hypothetical protein